MLAVIVMGGNVIKNKIIDVEEELGNENTSEAEYAAEHQSERNVDRSDQSGSDRQH